MKSIPLLTLFALLSTLTLHAEGTRQLAPNESITIDGNVTTDIAALHLDHAAYNNFAAYNQANPHHRLYVHIEDPAAECVYLGFSHGHLNETTQFPTQITFEFRVKDPAGNIIYGPVTIDPVDDNIDNWEQAHTGPMQIFGPDGYDAMQVSSADLMSAGWSGAGDYYIEFRAIGTFVTEFLIDFWDITVADCTADPQSEILGRLWTFNWSIFAINDFGFPNRPFNGAFYVCAPDPDNPDAAFITLIDFDGSGFRPAAFNIAFNSFGIQNTGNVMVDRRSVENTNATQSEYAVYLNDPVETCETATTGEIHLMGVSRCTEEEFCINFSASKEGQIDLLLDFDGQDDIYTPGTADVMVAVNVPEDQVGVTSCIACDGLDGLGNSIWSDPDATIPIVISYAQGIYHFPVYDAELMTDGFNVQAVRPAAPQPLLYYDDSNITVPSGSGEPAVQLSGCVLPCHRWLTFVDNSVPGFGNLHTINSWWFSQLIIQKEVYALPAFLECSISGPDQICEGATEELHLQPMASPTGAPVPEIIAANWTGPEIVGNPMGNTITIGASGLYTVEVSWLTVAGDTCLSSCSFELTAAPPTSGSLDTLLVQGDSIEINGEIFTEGGQYMQELTAANGCDSILTINIVVLQNVLSFNLDACQSNIFEYTNRDYTEFTPSYPQPVSCAQLEATVTYRENPDVNAHSCTPGVDDSPAMCISSVSDCAFDPGNERALIFEVTVTPSPDTAVALTMLSFFERAPAMFDWIDGDSGVNNPPSLYGVRVLKDGVEIFTAEDIATSEEWSAETFDFLGLDGFATDTVCTYRFELLGYCVQDNGGLVAAWDLDEISVLASCASPAELQGRVAGQVFTDWNGAVADVAIELATGPDFANAWGTTTDAQGRFSFDARLGGSYFLRGAKNTDFLEGVTSLDLLVMQRHILGIESFTSPLQWIAADANASETISALDLITLQRLLLGIDSKLQHSTSWRFGNAYQDLSVDDPWNFNETVEIQELKGDVLHADFIAVKIGDVNGSLALPPASSRISTPPKAVVTYRDTPVKAGETVRVDILADGADTWYGMQYALSLTGAVLERSRKVALENGTLNMDDAWAFDGQTLRVSWTAPYGHRVQRGEVLFSIVIEAHQDVMISELFRMERDILNAEVYTGDQLDVRSLEFSPGSAHPGTLSVEPNPFSQSTKIVFELSEESEAALRVYDIAGTLVTEVSGQFPAGLHSLDLAADDLSHRGGVYLCHLHTSEGVRVGKIVLVE